MTGVSLLWTSCSPLPQGPTAAEILGNPNYQAISYGGYRAISRDTVPSVNQIKDDMRILSAIDVKILRTYNTELTELPNLLQAITELKQEDLSFEMYVMVGAWINCKDVGQTTQTTPKRMKHTMKPKYNVRFNMPNNIRILLK